MTVNDVTNADKHVFVVKTIETSLSLSSFNNLIVITNIKRNRNILMNVKHQFKIPNIVVVDNITSASLFPSE